MVEDRSPVSWTPWPRPERHVLMMSGWVWDSKSTENVPSSGAQTTSTMARTVLASEVT